MISTIISVLLAITGFAASPVAPEPVAYQSLPPIETTVEYHKPIATTTPEIAEKKETIYCSCVKTARAEGLDLPRGNAIDLVPNSVPTIGGGILISYGEGVDDSHVGVIVDFTDEGYTTVNGNIEECERTIDVIAYNDPRIRGFWTRQGYEESLSQSLALQSETSSSTPVSLEASHQYQPSQNPSVSRETLEPHTLVSARP